MSDQLFAPTQAFHVADEPQLFEAVRWAAALDRAFKVRVIETVAGPYGAIDQDGTTIYFDTGDTLAFVLDRLVVCKPEFYETNTIELEDESE